MIRKNIYICLLYFCSQYLFYIHSNKLTFQILYYEYLIVFDDPLLIKLQQKHIILVSLIVETILLGLAFTLSAPAAEKTESLSI